MFFLNITMEVILMGNSENSEKLTVDRSIYEFMLKIHKSLKRLIGSENIESIKVEVDIGFIEFVKSSHSHNRKRSYSYQNYIPQPFPMFTNIIFNFTHFYHKVYVLLKDYCGGGFDIWNDWVI